ncbi:Uncharacterised protein [Achromobacter sp. 2789STDY5608615]|uniref:hypothetical protein n=1 Tax=Achromobacter sp. 2789STDY5608615 TaxID=1806492 RepID=UPI0006C03576|nr:hypothetical protein [Achromobacter sp. 2789STDY5608615]CUJ82280.1 Uncharacterised protein [Achromobacter sp. 2789STDY5608615]
MHLSEKTTEVMLKELATRTPEDRERLAQVSENFDRLVRAGVVSLETYKVQPTSPSAYSRLHAKETRF